MSGELTAGSRIAELSLVDRLGVSRTPIRASLQRLELEGLLEALPGGGYKVRQFHEVDIEDTIEIRATLEGLAARLAAERGISPSELTRARELLVCIDAILSEPSLDAERFSLYTVRNDELHALIVEMSGSAVVREQLERINNLPFAAPGCFLRAQLPTHQGLLGLMMAHDQHHAMIDAISNREGARAESLMREHARRTRSQMTRVVQNRTTSMVPGGALIRRRVSV
jgi:GntR family transcriptional regulator of vanillate catabolism